MTRRPVRAVAESGYAAAGPACPSLGMSRSEERRAAVLVLLLALAGIGVRLMSSGRQPSGAVAYRAATGARPVRDSVAARAARLTRPLRRGERIDVDRAAAEELVRLPRIGPALAARIVRDRDARGPFGSVEELTRVAGVGPALVDAVRPHAGFSGRPESRAPSPGRNVSLNTASAAELAELPGVGPVKAQAIIEDRRRNGHYRTVADLTRVRGIGPATLEKIRGRVVVP